MRVSIVSKFFDMFLHCIVVVWFGLVIWRVWRACGLLHALRVPSRQAKSACGCAACRSDILQQMPNQVRLVMEVGMLVSSLYLFIVGVPCLLATQGTWIMAEELPILFC